jgi:two-component system, OmpR family, sensor kinase
VELSCAAFFPSGLAQGSLPVAVCEIVEAGVAGVSPEAVRRGVAIAVEPPPELLVNAAPVAAKIALANSLDNAVKFSPSGGHVTVTFTAGRAEAVIAVSDTGPGMAPDDVPRLFHRFYRGNASRSTGVPGVGLGLAISRALVERQGGRIPVQADRERGATFGVHLPRA